VPTDPAIRDEISCDRPYQDIVDLGNFEVVLWWNGENDRWSFFVPNRTGSNSVSVGDATAIGNWTTVCGRYDGTSMTLWVDGERVASRDASGVVTNNPGRNAIGANGGRERFYRGKVDDVRIYNRSLSPAKIARISLEMNESEDPDR